MPRTTFATTCAVTRRRALAAPRPSRTSPASASRNDRSGAQMTPAARLSAAIEVVAEIDARRRPASDALKDWGLEHRFAGSSDRAAIAGLVYDALRRKASSAWLMGASTPRAALLGMLQRERGLGIADIEALCNGTRFSPPPLTEAERAALGSGSMASAPAPVQGE